MTTAEGLEALKLTAHEQAALLDFWLVYDQHVDPIAADVQKDVTQTPELVRFLAVDDPGGAAPKP
jgi:hypothetical protein